MSDNLSSLLYTKDHEWIMIKDSTAVVGITDYAEKALGDIVFVELPTDSEEIDAGDEFGTIESVKSVSPLFMPVSGRVTEVNSDLHDHPELINEDCYGDGWLMRIEISNLEEKEELMDLAAYESYLAEVESE